MKTNLFPKQFRGLQLFLPTVFLLFFNVITTWSQNDPPAPYFYLPGGAQAAEAFPLLHTEADVNITGIIADVKIAQLYQNTGTQPIEAVYLFPASTNAAVNAMQMTIGDRTIKAEIQEKNRAKATYQKAKSEGRSASLLEQQRPNVFQMRVANIMPGDTIKVELNYTELLVPEDGLYEFVYPTVVGPRYAGETPKAQLTANKWVANPYLKEGEAPNYSFDFNLCLRAGIPVKEVHSPSHQVEVHYPNKNEVTVELSRQDQFKGNKDFILQYRLKGNQIESGMLLYEGEEENFFLMMMQPPKKPKPEEMPGREYIFLVDVSGSMSGFPLDISKKLIQSLIAKLRPTDRFNVLLFAGTAGFLSEQSVAASPENIQKAIQVIDTQRGGGGTNMLNAVKKAMTQEKMERFSRSFVILTDGYVNVEAELFDYIRYHLGEANFFAFGIGSSVNRFLIEGMAHVGFSTPFVATQQAEAKALADRFQHYIQNPVLTNINLSFQGMEVYDVTPKQIPDLMGDRPVVVFGKYVKSPEKGARAVLSGQNGKKTFLQNIDINTVHPKSENAALRYLWARHRIKMLGDYTKANYQGDRDLVSEITGLGLKYNLLTSYTSFVAVDKKVRNSSGKSKEVKQPLPLPEGVPNSAVGQKPGYSPNYNALRLSTPDVPSNSHESKEDMFMRGRLSPSSSGMPPPPVIQEVPQEELLEEEEVVFLDQSLEEELNPSLFAAPRSMPPSPPPPPPMPEVEEVFKVVEEMPRFPGCEHLSNASERTQCAQSKMQEFIYKNLNYPAVAKENGVEGTVVIQFTIDKDGSIKNIRLLRDIGGECGTEAFRLIRLMIDKGLVWIPGKQRGRKVAVQYHLPIKFRLE